MLRLIFGFAVSIALLGSAIAEDWGGVVTPAVPTQIDYETSVTRVISGDASGDLIDQERVDTFALYGVTLPSTYGVVDTIRGQPLTLEGDPRISASCGSALQYASAPFLTIQTSPNSFASVTSFTLGDSTCPPGVVGARYSIPISNFARSSSVDALEAQIGAMSSELNAIAAYVPAIQQQMEETAWRGAAMAAALDSVGPAAGKRNRVGTNAATVNGETAVALNYVYAGDTMDVSAGVAYSEGEAISKVGVGISW